MDDSENRMSEAHTPTRMRWKVVLRPSRDFWIILRMSDDAITDTVADTPAKMAPFFMCTVKSACTE